jgi:hypothetical protein
LNFTRAQRLHFLRHEDFLLVISNLVLTAQERPRLHLARKTVPEKP